MCCSKIPTAIQVTITNYSYTFSHGMFFFTSPIILKHFDMSFGESRGYSYRFKLFFIAHVYVTEDYFAFLHKYTPLPCAIC